MLGVDDVLISWNILGLNGQKTRTFLMVVYCPRGLTAYLLNVVRGLLLSYRCFRNDLDRTHTVSGAIGFETHNPLVPVAYGMS